MEYELIREKYRPVKIKVLFIAESPPPADSSKPTTRAFYRLEAAGDGDRLFNNTMQALYPDEVGGNLENPASRKAELLQRFQADGFYMIEVLDESLVPGTKTSQRQKELKEAVPALVEKVKKLADDQTKIILIKSNPFKICADPLREAGFDVLNTETLNYPGYWQEKAYREKLAKLLTRT